MHVSTDVKINDMTKPEINDMTTENQGSSTVTMVTTIVILAWLSTSRDSASDGDGTTRNPIALYFLRATVNGGKLSDFADSLPFLPFKSIALYRPSATLNR
jgi:hypothetical protein